jgi:hypothetical protein
MRGLSLVLLTPPCTTMQAPGMVHTNHAASIQAPYKCADCGKNQLQLTAAEQNTTNGTQHRVRVPAVCTSTRCKVTNNHSAPASLHHGTREPQYLHAVHQGVGGVVEVQHRRLRAYTTRGDALPCQDRYPSTPPQYSTRVASPFQDGCSTTPRDKGSVHRCNNGVTHSQRVHRCRAVECPRVWLQSLHPCHNHRASRKRL